MDHLIGAVSTYKARKHTARAREEGERQEGSEIRWAQCEEGGIIQGPGSTKDGEVRWMTERQQAVKRERERERERKEGWRKKRDKDTRGV